MDSASNAPVEMQNTIYVVVSNRKEPWTITRFPLRTTYYLECPWLPVMDISRHQIPRGYAHSCTTYTKRIFECAADYVQDDDWYFLPALQESAAGRREAQCYVDPNVMLHPRIQLVVSGHEPPKD